MYMVGECVDACNALVLGGDFGRRPEIKRYNQTLHSLRACRLFLHASVPLQWPQGVPIFIGQGDTWPDQSVLLVCLSTKVRGARRGGVAG